jgi:hypothetical protein
MSLIPQWKVPTGMGVRWGFDETVTPRWLMVGHQESKAMLLDFAPDKIIKSINPRIAAISDGGMEGQSRFFMIEGKSPGRTNIEVRNPKTNVLESLLAVRVKKERKFRVSFHFVEDKGGNKTVHHTGIADNLIDELNNIYESQTNIMFELWGAGDLKLDFNLNSGIMEGWDANKKQWTGDGKIALKDFWKKVFVTKGDRAADFNIYLIPADQPANLSDTLIFTDLDNCIIEDGRQPVTYAIAHAIGRMLGCPITSDPNKMNQLMFWDPGIGANFFSRSDDFIPRNCVNIMNP